MRRAIIQKKANSQIFPQEPTLKSDNSQNRPETSFKDQELKNICQEIFTENSNSFFTFRKSQVLNLETLGNLKEDFPFRSRSKNNSVKKKNKLFFSSGETSKKVKIADFQLLIEGRPLTAQSLYREARRTPNINLKKRCSIYSYGESDLITPLEPKFYDEEYIGIEEYAKNILNQPAKTSIGVLAKGPSIQEKEEDSRNCRCFSPVINSSYFQAKPKRVGLLVTTPFQESTVQKTVSGMPKGKIRKGLSVRPFTAKRPRFVHNIMIN